MSNKIDSKKASLLALAAAGLCLTGCAMMDEASSGPDIIKCMGINQCKGQSSCKTSRSACKGLNNCRQSGWIATTEQDCREKNGKFNPDPLEE